jgi:hypothetical protein
MTLSVTDFSLVMKMSLQKWVEYGWLRAESSSADEVRGLISIMSRSLKDAQVEAISDDLRFHAAFSAALKANLALRASGYRTRVQAGSPPENHRVAGANAQRRSEADSEVAAVLQEEKRDELRRCWESISQQDLQQAIKVAAELERSVMGWIREHHSALL